MKRLWFSCSRFTVQVNVDERDIIIWTAPITRKFIGQPLGNLRRWAGQHQIVEITPDAETATQGRT